jgi:CHAT domain-containing protein
MVPLGAASTVDALISQWRQQMRGLDGVTSAIEAERSYRAAGQLLRHRVWDPIAAKVAGTTTVFVVPDGTLNLLSFAALPVGNASYLIERGPVIHYLTAERDLVTSADHPPANRGLLAVGGATFDDPTVFSGNPTSPPTARRTPRRAGSKQRRTNCGDLSSLQFEPLPETTREVRTVASLWVEPPVQVLERGAANERAFKQSAPGHRVLHLATHGFFLGSSCSPALSGTRAVGALAAANLQNPRPNAGMIDNPLLLSGLALAGANRRAQASHGDEDGILTAEEVASLQLSGVEWAVLSACDTGLGEVKVGEGILGLRRAFHIAGVRTVIMSLWSVDDNAAGEWMKALYLARTRELTTSDAGHQASLTVLRSRRTAGRTTHPFYWAAFTAAGDWR